MALRKLWNSIRGKSTAPTDGHSDQPSVEAPSAATNAPANTATGNSAPSVAAQPTVSVSISTALKSAKNAVSREDKKLCRRVESLSVRSVLDIGVGDGARSLALLDTLTHKGHSNPIHYIVIDQFEMGGSPLTLRGFHKQLREYPAKAQLVPMPIDAGLDRVVRTYGQVDLILWSDQKPPTDSQRSVISRLSKPHTMIFSLDGGRWSEALSGLIPPARRAA